MCRPSDVFRLQPEECCSLSPQERHLIDGSVLPEKMWLAELKWELMTYCISKYHCIITLSIVICRYVKIVNKNIIFIKPMAKKKKQYISKANLVVPSCTWIPLRSGQRLRLFCCWRGHQIGSLRAVPVETGGRQRHNTQWLADYD